MFCLCCLRFMTLSFALTATGLVGQDESAVSNSSIESVELKPSQEEGKLQFKDLIEGRPVTVEVPLFNHLSVDLDNIVAKVSCGCVRTTLSSTELADNGEMKLVITIVPPKDILHEKIVVSGLPVGVEAGRRVLLASILLEGTSYPPIRLSEEWVELDENSEATIELVSAPGVHIVDSTKIGLQSETFEIRRTEELDGNYRLHIGLKAGAERPSKDAAAFVTAPFQSGEGPVQQMQELVHLLSESRLEVAPNPIRLSSVSPGAARSSDSGWTSMFVVKKFSSQSGAIKAVLVADVGGKTQLLDPAPLQQILPIGKSNVFRANVRATVYDSLVPEGIFSNEVDCFLVLHVGREPLDLTLPIAELQKKFSVIPVYFD